jgi:hypothetical protein
LELEDFDQITEYEINEKSSEQLNYLILKEIKKFSEQFLPGELRNLAHA